MSNDKSEFYKLGYKTGFRDAVLYVKKHFHDEVLTEKLIEEYNNYPAIVEMNIRELDI